MTGDTSKEIMLGHRKNFNPDVVHFHDEEGLALVSSLQGLGHTKNHRGYRRFPRTICSRWVALCCGLLVLTATYQVGWKIGLGGLGGNATDAEGTDPVGNEWPDWVSFAFVAVVVESRLVA